MQVTLIKASLTDAEEFLDIQKKAFWPLLEKYQDENTNPANESLQNTLRRFNNPQRDMYFICVGNNRIGMMIIASSQDRCTLIRIGILPEYQNKGYAQKAILNVEKLYPNATVWTLDTIKQEEKLCYLYEKMGYVRTGKEERIKDGMDLIFFAK